MPENDPFDLYKQKYDVMPVFRDTDLEVVLFPLVQFYTTAIFRPTFMVLYQQLRRQLYYQLRDKYSAG